MNQDKHLCRCSEVLLEVTQNPSTSCTAWQAFLENASLLLAHLYLVKNIRHQSGSLTLIKMNTEEFNSLKPRLRKT